MKLVNIEIESYIRPDYSTIKEGLAFNMFDYSGFNKDSGILSIILGISSPYSMIRDKARKCN